MLIQLTHRFRIPHFSSLSPVNCRYIGEPQSRSCKCQVLKVERCRQGVHDRIPVHLLILILSVIIVSANTWIQSI